MSKSGKTYKYSVELNVYALDAPGTRLTTKNDIYINICLLGIHKRTHLMPPNLPMHIDQRFYFDKIFKSCHNPRDIIQRLEREHVLIELLQSAVPSPIVLASYETSAKDFLYPYSTAKVQYAGVRRHILLGRTIDFPGVAPSLEFIVSPSVDDATGITSAIKTHKYTKPINSYGKTPKRSKSPTWKPSSAYPNRSSLNTSGGVSRSLTSHTIATAVRNDYSQRETQEKLRELAVPGEVKYVVPIDKTLGRQPFVVRHMDRSKIDRKPKSHIVLNDGLVVNDYSLSRAGSSLSLYSSNGGLNRSRSVSPYNNQYYGTTRPRTRSPSQSRRSAETSKSVDFDYQGRSRTPPRRSNLRQTTRFSTNYDDHHNNDEFHSTKDCAICRLHRIHSEQSRRAKSLDQQHYTTTSSSRLYSPDTYSNNSHPISSATLLREPFRHRYTQSPAGELSDKVIHTLRHNLESYSSQPWHNYYSSFRYSDGHSDDDELLERSRRLTQD